MAIDIFAVTKRFRHSRTRDQAAQVAPVHAPGRVIVGVEEERVLRNRGPVVPLPGPEDECFEKPGRMGKVPLRGADIWHRLDNAVFRLEIAHEQSGEITHIMKTCAECFSARLRHRLHRFSRRRLRHLNFLPIPVLRDAPRAFDRELLPRDLR